MLLRFPISLTLTDHLFGKEQLCLSVVTVYQFVYVFSLLV